MNRIIRNHVPARDLPENLRADIAPDALVTVTIEEERKPLSMAELLSMLEGGAMSREREPISVDEAVRRVRALRDEWE
jgi:hypothetical protein